MTVYVDDMQRPAKVGRIDAVWSHLLADTDDELHRFAMRLGLKKAWFQKPGTPIAHYDVTEPKRQQAIQLGAVQIGYMSTASTDLIRRRREALLTERATRPEPVPAAPTVHADPANCGRCHHPRTSHGPFCGDTECRCDGYKYSCPSCGHHFTVEHTHRADCQNQPQKREA